MSVNPWQKWWAVAALRELGAKRMQGDGDSSHNSHIGKNGSRPATIPADQRQEPSGEIIELELNDLAYGGDAVGRYDGRAVFVPGALPGELVRARLMRERSNYARATLIEVLRPSPDRVPLRYSDLSESGGFQWQHLSYPAQLEWKSRIVRQLLIRIGKFPDPDTRPTLGMPTSADPWRYRTVAQFAIAPDGAIGFRRMESHDVLDMPDCPIVHPQLDTLYQATREWMRERWGARAFAYTERFTLRVAVGAPGAQASGPLTLVSGHTYRDGPRGLLTIEARPGASFAADGSADAVAGMLLKEIPGLAGVVILGLPGGRGRVIAGQDFVHERVLHRIFRISAGSFFQVNPTQTPILVEQALTALQPRPTDIALDGYSGAGLFSLFLAEQVATVRAIESQPSAVADARASATLNGVTNVVSQEGLLERTLGTMRRQREHIDLALIDPPRSGCLPRALIELTALEPRTIVYVSCDPSTLARDLRIICDNGYTLTSVQPVDMFPFTSHIECVATCQRIRP
ncbi:MAG TPA: 23S rRNA (uracil(1939)-C(5))-methyltransferase RlmD [Ktedonobacterales bacterium]